MLFSQRLKELRIEKSCTLTEIAKNCGVSVQCISSLEMGTRNPTGSTLNALADFFQVSTDYLLGRTDDFGNLVNSDSSIANSQSSDLSGNRDKYLVDFEKYFKLLTEIQKAQVLGYVMGLLEQNGIKINSIK